MRFYRSEILGRLWVRGEYLAWGMRGQYFPALVTTSLPGTPPDQTGVPGRPRTVTLVGDDEWRDEMSSGGRLSGGFWWSPEQYGGIEGSYFEIDTDSHHLNVGNGLVSLARPYRNATTGQWESLLVSYPGLQSGAIAVSAETQFVGAEALLRHVVCFGESYRVDVVGGYRHAYLGDQLMITESITSATTGSTQSYDLFRTQNDFHGAQAGVIARWRRDNLAIQLLGKVGLGDTVTHVAIDGGTATVLNGQYTGSAGGLLAQSANMGTYRNSGFATFEELGLNLDVQLTCTARAFFGYSFLYWSRVARVADQLDLNVGHALDLKTTNFWAQGINVGLEYQF
jgi:hypothetical protein